MQIQNGKKLKEALSEKVDRSILAITDFTKSSTNAIIFAVNLFKNSNLNLQLLHVFETPTEKATLLISVEDILTKDSEAGLKKQAAEITSLLKNQHFTISTHSKAGKLKTTIENTIQAENVDLIVTCTSNLTGTGLTNIPMLFLGQSLVPLLIVPEKCNVKNVKNVLTLQLSNSSVSTKMDKSFEKLVNHDHLTSSTFQIQENKFDHSALSLIQDKISSRETDLIILIPALRDRFDKALKDFSVPELYSSIASLLNH